MKYNARNYGFTLIELMVAVTIMAILMGLVIGLSGVARSKSADAQARTDLQNLASAIEEYKMSKGSYPLSLTELVTSSNRVPVELMLKVKTIDPWVRPFIYKDITKYGYTLYSDGPLTNTADDDIKIGAVQ